jgi:hypothetical protein
VLIMTGEGRVPVPGKLRTVGPSFVVPGPSGVAVRDRLKGLAAADEQVLRAVGGHLGSLASRDLARRCRDGLGHSAQTWAARKRELTPLSSARWAGAITRATHDQWALACRGQLARIQDLEAGVKTIAHRLSLPVGERGSKRVPGGYRSRQEWHAKARRLRVLQDQLAAARAGRQAGVVHVVRGGKRLARTRHNLGAAGLTEAGWRQRWEAARWFLQADGESGKRYGNETIRVSPDGEVSIRLPAPLAHLANAPHGRYVLACRVRFAHRGQEWRDRIEADRATAYRIHLDVDRGRWYITASWHYAPATAIPLKAALADGVVAFDMNDDHLAGWRLDVHGNPRGNPRRFYYGLSGTASHRDAQIRHTLTRVLHWARACGVHAIAIEDLDFRAGKTREKHGRRTRFRRLISGFPTAKLRDRLISMATGTGLAIVAADPAYTSRWGAQHWQKPLTTATRKPTRHDAAAVAIGRRALGHPIRRRTAPPPHDQSDRAGHRTAQAGPGTPGREEPRPRSPGPRTRSARAGCGENAGDQRAQHRSGHTAEQVQPMLSP